MSTPPDRHEYPSTYLVQDRSNEQELTRLTVQDRLMTNAMGGVLPEQPNPTTFRRVLDVGCGTGGWILEAARTYPGLSLTGIDISKPMIDYACQQAEAQQFEKQTEFHVMDALLLLEFPTNSFDLVNMRYGTSFMRIWEWTKLLNEMQRVSRKGGIIRITEPEIVQESSSPALTRFLEMLQCALFKSGHLFEEKTTGLTAHLASQLTKFGCRNVQTKIHALEFQAGTTEGQAFYEDALHAIHTFRPFIQKWGCMSKEYNTICQQALQQIQQLDFHVTYNLLTAWGIVPD
jgi:ubiquinone/menaquinone biosynthesis C-methylase UbiE